MSPCVASTPRRWLHSTYDLTQYVHRTHWLSLLTIYTQLTVALSAHYIYTQLTVALSAHYNLVTFCVNRRQRKMYCGHARLSVCLSVRGRTPTLLHGPGCNLGAW